MEMQFHKLDPHPLLRNYIEKMWVFRSQGKMPSNDIKLVVPNGNMKLTLSCHNGIVASVNGKTFTSNECDITLTGMINVPVILDVEKDTVTETIGIEFSPKGTYRFFKLNFNEIQNHIYSLQDILASKGKRLTEEINNTPTVKDKIILLQQFLITQLSHHDEDQIFDYCIEKIIASKGAITVKDLEKKTGYSSRWLNMKFNEKLGISPKNLSSIIKFKQYYQAFIDGNKESFFRNDFYTLYYDQSHLIKDFKRFTGLSPARFDPQANNFGQNYYRE